MLVTTLANSGPGSLRQAILDANAAPGADTIAFGVTGIITLTTGQLVVTDSVNIAGPGAGLLTVSGNNASRVFYAAGAGALDLSMSGITITKGKTPTTGDVLAIACGAISALGNVTVRDCVITSNTAVQVGGVGVTGTLTLINSQVTNNSGSVFGGGVGVLGSAVIQRSTIAGNTTPGGAAGLLVDGSLLLEETTISGNIASTDGGGIYLRSSSATAVTIRNSTISGNSAGASGGGLVVGLTPNTGFNGTLTIQNSTITNNKATSGTGGGIAHFFGPATINLESSVVAGNFNAAAPDLSTVGPISGSTSAVGNTAGAVLFIPDATTTALIGANLKLGLLANNGGPTKTHLPALDSPLVNKGANPSSAINDQRGIAFPRSLGGQPDIGSVEVLNLVVTTVNDAGPGSLRQALADATATAGPQVVTFDPTVFATAKTITLTSGALSVSGPDKVQGPGSALLTVSGNNASQVFVTPFTPAGLPVTLTDLTLTQGLATGILSGGAVAAATNLVLERCVITGNESMDRAGAVVVYYPFNLTMTDCVVSNNSAASNCGAFAVGGSATVRRSAISGNTSGANVGGLYCDGLVMEDSTVSGNSATFSGGGLLLFERPPAGSSVIRNSTISGNTAGSSGGGVALGFSNYPFNGTLTIQNSTIVGNTANGSVGGGIARLAGIGSIALVSSIVSGNNNVTAPDISSGSKVTVNFSAVGSKSGFTGIGANNLAFGLDLKLGPLASNGGPTQTHRPGPASPLRNAGSNPAALTFDQRGSGFPRTLSGLTDIGAVESLDPTPTATLGGITTVVAAGPTPNTFTVTYADDNAINVATIDLNDVKVQAPDASFLAVTGATVDVNTNGSPRVVTYTFAVPGGAWDPADNGTYSVIMQANQVADTDATVHFVAAGETGTLQVAIPVTYVVDEVSDIDDGNTTAGHLSLREAVGLANASAGIGDTIVFASAVFGTAKTIALSAGELLVTDGVTIIGPGATLLTVSGAGLSRVLKVAGPGTLNVTIAGLTIANGLTADGPTIGSTQGDGAGVQIDDEAVALDGVVVRDCTSAGEGGGIGVGFSGSLTLRNCTVSGNQANGGGGGGIYFFANGSLLVVNSTISGNTTAGEGGGLYFYGNVQGGLVIRNSTVSGNTAGTNGGGVILRQFTGTLLVQNSTITGNNAADSGGGIGRVLGTGTVSLQSTIVAGNLIGGAAHGKADLSFDAPVTAAADYCLIGIMDPANNLSLTGTGNLTGSLATPLDAKLGALADNGGPTRTHALLAGSPAIDAGDNPAALTTDQRGFARQTGAAVDIGAFEFGSTAAQPPAVSAVKVNDGTAQRSTVTSLTVSFSTPVSFPAGLAAAFTLERTGPGTPTGAVTLAFSQAGNDVTITFLAGGPVGVEASGSLIDGTYRLTVVAANVIGAGGQLDGDNNGSAGGDFVSPAAGAGSLHRLFGDADGDLDVDAIDYGNFRGAFGGAGNVPFDFDGDGDVDALDFGQFRQRFGGTLP